MTLLEQFNQMTEKEQEEFVQKIIDLINKKTKSTGKDTILHI